MSEEDKKEYLRHTALNPREAIGEITSDLVEIRDKAVEKYIPKPVRETTSAIVAGLGEALFDPEEGLLRGSSMNALGLRPVDALRAVDAVTVQLPSKITGADPEFVRSLWLAKGAVKGLSNIKPSTFGITTKTTPYYSSVPKQIPQKGFTRTGAIDVTTVKPNKGVLTTETSSFTQKYVPKSKGQAALKKYIQQEKALEEVLSGSTTSGAFLSVNTGENISTTLGLKKIEGINYNDPAFKIRELNKEYELVKVEEKLREKSLIRSGELKPPPDSKNIIKSSTQAAKYYGMESPELKEKFYFRYNNRASSLNPRWQLKSLKLNDIETAKRNLSIVNVTESKEMVRLGNKKWDGIKKRGQEGHHIIPIHVSTKLKDLYMFDLQGKPILGGAERWELRVLRDAEDGIYHGNHPRNIVAVRGSTKEPKFEAGQRSEIYHRRGKIEEDNPGYHKIESSIKWTTSNPDLVDLRPFRDLMRKQVELRNKADKIRGDIIGTPRKITTAPK